MWGFLEPWGLWKGFQSTEEAKLVSVSAKRTLTELIQQKGSLPDWERRTPAQRVSEPSKHDSTFWETKALRSADGKGKLLRAIGKAVIYAHVSLLCLWTRRTPESLSLLPGLSGKRPCFWMSTSSSSFSLLTFASMVMRVMFDHTVSNRDDFSFEK